MDIKRNPNTRVILTYQRNEYSPYIIVYSRYEDGPSRTTPCYRSRIRMREPAEGGYILYRATLSVVKVHTILSLIRNPVELLAYCKSICNSKFIPLQPEIEQNENESEN